MGFFDRVARPRDSGARVQEIQVLCFGPAVLWLSRPGAVEAGARAALAAAVATLGVPAGVSPARVSAAVAEMARQIRIGGRAGLVGRLNGALSPADRRDAVRLALAAMVAAGAPGPGDVAFLSDLAAELGVGPAEFDALFEAAGAFA